MSPASDRSQALRYLSLNWFAMVMGLAGLALAWARAVPLMGEMAGAGAIVLAGVAAVLFLALGVFSALRWQHHAAALAGDLSHPVRHAFVAALPISLILLATAATWLVGAEPWVAALWWLGSLSQMAATVWVAGRWLSADKGRALGWPAVTPALLLPAVGNLLAPLAGVALDAPVWSAAQFGVGALLWPVVLALLLARIAVQGVWSERLLPLTFITVAPPAVMGTGVLALGGAPVLAWMCWGVALFFLLWSAHTVRRMLAQPFSIAFWALGFPLSAFAALTLRLAMQFPQLQLIGMVSLAVASVVTLLLAMATWKGVREGSLLQAEPVAIVAVPGSGQPPGPQ